MFIKPRLRLVPDNTRIHFMRGRYMGLIVSAILSTASVVLFFYPGLNLGIDFSGGVVMEVRTQGPADFAQIHAALAAEHVPDQGVQRFGDASEVLIRLGAQPIGTGEPRRRWPGCGRRWRRAFPGQRSSAPMRSAPACRRSCSATACWRWGSAC